VRTAAYRGLRTLAERMGNDDDGEVVPIRCDIVEPVGADGLR
jgi:hypothetical protein